MVLILRNNQQNLKMLWIVTCTKTLSSTIYMIDTCTKTLSSTFSYLKVKRPMINCITKELAFLKSKISRIGINMKSNTISIFQTDMWRHQEVDHERSRKHIKDQLESKKVNVGTQNRNNLNRNYQVQDKDNHTSFFRLSYKDM